MSGVIYESETGNGLGRFEVDLEDGTHRFMTVNVTEEGIIMDVWAGHDIAVVPLGTVGMTFDEWADAIVIGELEDGIKLWTT